MTAYTPAELIAHRDRANLLEAILFAGAGELIASARAGPQCPFADALGRVPTWVGVEYLCQAVAAFEGRYRHERGAAIIPGLVLGTKHYEAAASHFPADAMIVIRVQPVMRNSADIGVYDGEIYTADGGVLASARLKAYMPDGVQSFLSERSIS